MDNRGKAYCVASRDNVYVLLEIHILILSDLQGYNMLYPRPNFILFMANPNINPTVGIHIDIL